MRAIPFALAAYEADPADPSRADRVFARHLSAVPLPAVTRRAVGLDPGNMRRLDRAYSSGELRRATRHVLRSAGLDAFVQDEIRFEFAWVRRPDPEVGTIFLLYILPVSESMLDAGLLLSAGLAVSRLNPVS